MSRGLHFVDRVTPPWLVNPRLPATSDPLSQFANVLHNTLYRGAAQKCFLFVYLFVLSQGTIHIKFINSDNINEAFLRFVTFA